MTTEVLIRKPALAARFEVVRNLGSGAASSVYLVRDKQLANQEVALKVLTNISAFDEHTLTRFRQEMDVLRSLRHPNIVQAYEYIEIEDAIAYTMEYVPGCDLGSLVHQRELSFEEIEVMFRQLLGALSELHQRGIVHRDLKLENVLVREDGVLKLSDLGLMKMLDGKGLTKTGILLGTAQYLPPEYIMRGIYDERGDIYAAGVVLYELLAGTRRLIDKPGMAAIEHLIKTKFEVPKIALTGVPKRFVQVTLKALEVDPTRRFQSVAEVRDALNGKGQADLGSEATLEPRLKQQSALSRISQTFGRAREKATPVWLIGGLLMLGAFVSLGVTMQILSGGPVVPFGKYSGQFTQGAHKGQPLTVRADQRGTFVDLAAFGCSAETPLSFGGQLKDCARGLSLEQVSVEGEVLRGVLKEPARGAEHPFELRQKYSARD